METITLHSGYFKQRTEHICRGSKIKFTLTSRGLGHLGRCPLVEKQHPKKTKIEVKQQNKTKRQEVVNYIEKLFFHANTQNENYNMKITNQTHL